MYTFYYTLIVKVNSTTSSDVKPYFGRWVLHHVMVRRQKILEKTPKILDVSFEDVHENDSV